MATKDAQATAGAVDATLAKDLYRRMLLIRGFEDRVQSLFLRGEIYGTTHLYSGQEAIAVGFASVLGEEDRIACTYRGHGHLLAMGTDPTGLLAELLGRASGVNGGLAGSMNVVDPDNRVLGCYGIVGRQHRGGHGRRDLDRPRRRSRRRVLRGRRRQPGVLLRVPELREGPQPAGRLRLREQQVRRVHADGGRDSRGDRGASGGDGDPHLDGRRDGPLGGSGRRRRGRRTRPQRRRAGVRRGRDLPLRRPLAQRSREVPAGGRARPLARARPSARGS